jgi:ribosome-associated toxin RatA of RatAB toxin-antitoxin module
VASDVEKYPDWAADIKSVTVTARDDDGRPVDVTFRAGAFGRSTSYSLEYDYSQAPEVLAWRQTSGDLTTRLDGSYRFESTQTGATTVTYVLTVELRVPLPGFIKKRAQGRIMHTALEELKSRVEAG